MQPRPLIELIDRYQQVYPDELRSVARVGALLRDRPRCFARDCFPAHFTASAWIVSADLRRFLLTHHRKLDRWLQLGGHADGASDLPGAALREAREESGMRDFEWPMRDGHVLPVDLDVHGIPPHDGEPAHEHYDVRFVLVARAGQSLRRSSESKDLRWFEREELEQVTEEESLLRFGRKAYAWLDENPPRSVA